MKAECPFQMNAMISPVNSTNLPGLLSRIIKSGYAVLQLKYFFTARAEEVRAWAIRKATKAPQAAGNIHADFQKGFNMAEVMKFQDFKEEGSESAVKFFPQSPFCAEGRVD
ncbi:obg-like ATPase 1 isoform X4 [Thalassophryne amazonica]|uniref:obg-like ATPase 1 isoform X4 n=1 Tax=Thalassophryne amazonica TaxID=390379 RepID=UPI001470B069|nr:obg-like ATPase 1 isoform X4 [Thalassophryne amazonica]